MTDRAICGNGITYHYRDGRTETWECQFEPHDHIPNMPCGPVLVNVRVNWWARILSVITGRFAQ